MFKYNLLDTFCNSFKNGDEYHYAFTIYPIFKCSKAMCWKNMITYVKFTLNYQQPTNIQYTYSVGKYKIYLYEL